MDSKTHKIEELVEKTQQTSSENERKEFANEANKLHQKITGHKLSVDEHGNIDKNSKDAKKCPMLQ